MNKEEVVKSEQITVRKCTGCVHKSVCILYYGHGQLELRFGHTSSKNQDEFINRLDEQLARQCRFYLEDNNSSED